MDLARIRIASAILAMSVKKEQEAAAAAVENRQPTQSEILTEISRAFRELSDMIKKS
jgi:hypothetical protein